MRANRETDAETKTVVTLTPLTTPPRPWSVEQGNRSLRPAADRTAIEIELPAGESLSLVITETKDGELTLMFDGFRYPLIRRNDCHAGRPMSQVRRFLVAASCCGTATLCRRRGTVQKSCTSMSRCWPSRDRSSLHCIMPGWRGDRWWSCWL